MRLLISLPCKARELEGALRRHCEANGAWDETVDVEFIRDPNSHVLLRKFVGMGEPEITRGRQ